MDELGKITKRERQALVDAISFLKQSIVVNDGLGSAHSYSFWLNPFNGWHKSYPETTGYLLPTLLKASNILNDKDCYNLGKKSAKWLGDIQSEDGSFYKGVYPALGSSVFNTAIIVQGWLDVGGRWGDYEEKIRLGYRWLQEQQEEDGIFIRHAYIKDFSPTYDMRIAWSLIQGGLALNDIELLKSGERVMENLHVNFSGEIIQNAGFGRGEAPFLHTVSYALRGWIESTKLLGRENAEIDRWLDYFEELWLIQGSWPGRLWPHDYGFVCCTGHAQMALCFLAAGRKPKWIEEVIQVLINAQKKEGVAKGGIPGSIPFYGPYMRLRYPNWASKFFVDLLMAYYPHDDASVPRSRDV